MSGRRNDIFQQKLLVRSLVSPYYGGRNFASLASYHGRLSMSTLPAVESPPSQARLFVDHCWTAAKESFIPSIVFLVHNSETSPPPPSPHTVNPIFAHVSGVFAYKNVVQVGIGPHALTGRRTHGNEETIP